MPKRRAPAPIALVSAVVRVFSVLERMSRERSVGLEELSREIGLAKPTVYRFLQTLQELGYVRRDERDKWAMTLKLFNVGSRALDHLDLYSAARPTAERLSEDLGETVHMGVLEGDSGVYVLKIESKYTIRMFSRVGRRIPLYCTSIGKVLLAYMAEDERRELLKDIKLVAFTPKTIVAREALDCELERIRSEGLAHDDEEHEEGIRCIGAPIFDYTGSIVAAMSASWPRFRWDRGDEAQMAAKVKEAAAKVSGILGMQADQ